MRNDVLTLYKIIFGRDANMRFSVGFELLDKESCSLTNSFKISTFFKVCEVNICCVRILKRRRKNKTRKGD